MPYDSKDITANINVIDFKISNIANPVLSVDFNKVTFVFTGVANPQNADVSLIDYQYSLDSGIIWSYMTADTGSELTGLTFNSSGLPYNFIWKIKEDLGNSIYNIPIKIRFKAQATFDAIVTQTAYKTRSITIVKKVIIPKEHGKSVFPDNYSGVSLKKKDISNQ